MSQRCRRSREKSCARKIGSDGNHQQRTSSLFAGLPSRRNIPLDRDGGEQENSQDRAADHPAHRDPCESHGPGLEHIVEAEIADRLNNPGEHKTKCKDESGTVVRTAEPDQRICRIAKTEESTADFKIQVSLRGAGNGGLAQVKNRAKKQKGEADGGSDQDARTLLPKKPDDLAPTTHETPQIPKKQLQHRRNASLCPFWLENLSL